jgi:hypothetical protein
MFNSQNKFGKVAQTCVSPAKGARHELVSSKYGEAAQRKGSHKLKVDRAYYFYTSNICNVDDLGQLEHIIFYKRKSLMLLSKYSIPELNVLV